MACVLLNIVVRLSSTILNTPTFLKAFVIEIPANIVGIIPILSIILSRTSTTDVPVFTMSFKKFCVNIVFPKSVRVSLNSLTLKVIDSDIVFISLSAEPELSFIVSITL